jgi:hypothetical protein
MMLKKIIFFHYSFAIPAEVTWEPEGRPIEIKLLQSVALDLPKEMQLVVEDRRLVGFPDVFHDHMDTLRSITEAIRDQGIPVYLRQLKY